MNRENELGALWWKKGQKGIFLSGHIIVNGEKIQIVCFEKRNKKNEKQPDFDILKSDPDWKNKKVADEGKEGYERHQVDEHVSEEIDADDIPL